MFGHLPEAVKQQVIHHLQNHNFPAAKQVYDSWIKQHDKISTGKQHIGSIKSTAP